MKIREIALSAAVIWLVLGAGCVSREYDPALAERVEKLENELTVLKKEQAELIDIKELFSGYLVNGRPGIALILRYLNLIQPPPNPTPEQIRQYIARVSGLGSSGFSDSPQIKAAILPQLTGFGREYLQDMLQHLNMFYVRDAARILIRPEDKDMLYAWAVHSNTPGGNAASELFLSMATPSDKDAVLKLLPGRPGAIDAVIRLGLEKDAMKIITNELAVRERLNDYRKWFLTAMENLDEAGQQELMRKLWRNCRIRAMHDQWGTWESARMLAEWGHFPAFKYMVENIQQDIHRQRQLLLLTPLQEIDDLNDWFRKNEKVLFFDKDRNMFMAPADMEAER